MLEGVPAPDALRQVVSHPPRRTRDARPEGGTADGTYRMLTERTPTEFSSMKTPRGIPGQAFHCCDRGALKRRMTQAEGKRHTTEGETRRHRHARGRGRASLSLSLSFSLSISLSHTTCGGTKRCCECLERADLMRHCDSCGHCAVPSRPAPRAARHVACEPIRPGCRLLRPP